MIFVAKENEFILVMKWIYLDR